MKRILDPAKRSSCTGKRSGGFTLVEVMIVVVILAVLATVAVVSYIKYQRRAKAMNAVTTLGDIKMKQEVYYTTFSRYACSTADCSCASSGFYPSEDPTISGTSLPVGITGESCSENDPFPKMGFCQLGMNPNGDFYFKYFFEGWDGSNSSNVAQCSSAPTCLPGSGSDCFPVDNTKPWWFAIAHGNLDGDPHNELSTFFISNSVDTVIKVNEIN